MKKNESKEPKDIFREEEKQEYPKKEKLLGKDIYLILFLLVVLIAGLSSLSFAFYKQYQTTGGSINSDNTIITGDIVFAYSDASSTNTTPSNGIQITNATPLSDDLGKKQSQDRSYFDFQIIAKPGKGKLRYQVILEKMETSSLSEADVKIYVTNLQGTEEVPVAETINYGSVKVYSQYSDLNHKELTGKILFERDIIDRDYQANYRLRMWVRDNARDYSNKTFSTRVNINAFSVAS